MTSSSRTRARLRNHLPRTLLHDAGLHPHWRALLGLLLLVVAWLSFAPASGGPTFAHADKLGHALAFAALGVAAALSWPPSSRASMRVAVALLAYGAIIEIVQGTLPSRSADGLDWVADAAGAAMGLWAVRAARLRWPAARA